MTAAPSSGVGRRPIVHVYPCQVREPHSDGESERLRLVGEFASAIAHDFSNLLAIVSSCTESVAEALKDEADLEALRDATLAAGHARQLVNDLRHFVRREERIGERARLHTVITDSVRLAQRLLKHVCIETSLDPSLDGVLVGREQWTSVFLNLAVNARDAMPDGGHLTFRTRIDETNGRDPWAVIQVTDTGLGFDEEVAGRMFEPFFTTRSESGGSGLGLSIVKSTVDESGGFIAATCRPGVDTTFEIRLPIHRASEAPRSRRSRAHAPEDVGHALHFRRRDGAVAAANLCPSPPATPPRHPAPCARR